MAALLAPERLPVDPEVPPRRRRDDWLRILFELEPLRHDAPAPPRRRGRWLRWLLAPERLDP